MRRISTDMPNNDAQFYLRRQEVDLNDIRTRIETGRKFNNLSDDPLSAAHSVRYASVLHRLEQYEKNAFYALDNLRITEGVYRQSVDVLQRIRELAVAGGNGVFTPDDMKTIGMEVNELLKELVTIANETGQDGARIFAGDKAFTEPFRLVEGTVDSGGENMVVRVEYRGAGASRRAETSQASYTDLDIGGGEAFWAEKMQIYSTFDATDYRARADGAFFIDGQEIQVTTGDTVAAIVAKINESPAPVKAYIDPTTRGLALEGANAHLIKAEDRQGSATLQELGIISANNDPSAPNWHPGARVSGGSVFDMVIRLRDALFRGDQDFVGSLGLGGMDLALGNTLSRVAELGSRMERVQATWERLNTEIPNTNAILARESGLDFASAATDLSMMDFAHKAALQTAARIIPPTLLDFLR
ncbi:MAG: flagellar hook-associated protein 3 [Spirochaetaceae bacterium]|jgi:flagellar hook-associated protein 3 FlgL|nr:flagellar hook-associated protein 3 [Spirochaetaceae bacterium]